MGPGLGTRVRTSWFGGLGAAGEGVIGDLLPELDGLADAACVSREGEVRVRGFCGGFLGGGLVLGGQGAGGGGAGQGHAEVTQFQAGGEVFGALGCLGWIGCLGGDGVQGVGAWSGWGTFVELGGGAGQVVFGGWWGCGLGLRARCLECGLV